MHSLIGKVNRDPQFGKDPEVNLLIKNFSIKIFSLFFLLVKLHFENSFDNFITTTQMKIAHVPIRVSLHLHHQLKNPHPTPLPHLTKQLLTWI